MKNNRAKHTHGTFYYVRTLAWMLGSQGHGDWSDSACTLFTLYLMTPIIVAKLTLLRASSFACI